MTQPLRIEPLDKPPVVTVSVPGSKSITNRALVCAALARGTSVLDGALLADDTFAMVECLRALGIGVEVDEPASVITVGGISGRLPPGPASVDARQSGTTARFVAPLLAVGKGRYRLDGHEQLRSRPMGPLFDALRSLGARVVEEGEPGRLPVVIEGGDVDGGRIEVTGDVSSQFLSGLLLAAPAMHGGLEVAVTTELVSKPYVDLTAEVMRSFGALVATGDRAYRVPRGSHYRAVERYVIEPDASAASYFFAAAVITGGRVRVEGLGQGSRQGDLRFVDVLERMGADVVRHDDATEVAAGAALHGIDVDLRDLSDMAPTLAAVAAFADSPTRVTGIAFISAKESDRIAAVVTELNRLGVDAEAEDDGFVIRPAGDPTAGAVQTYDDHRMAMSFALIGLRVPGIEIHDPSCVAKTFPDYFERLETLR